VFKSDFRVNKLGRRRVKIDNRSLLIRGRGTISVKLVYSKIRLYNTLFISNLGVNLMSSTRIVSKGFYAVYNNKIYIAIRCLDNKIIF
jgi:hypothetical protein